MLKQHKKNAQTKYPLFQSLLWIFLVTLFVSGGALATFYYYKYQEKQKRYNENYNIVALIQSCPTKENVKCIYLAEMVGLSLDNPTNLYSFDVVKGVNDLHSYFIFKSPFIKKVSPGTLFIDYQIRQPIAFLGNYSNSSFDEGGTIFPFKPFFHPKKIPFLFVNESFCESCPWGKKVEPRFLKIFKTIQDHLEFKEQLFLEQVDLSNIDSLNAGKKEIILVINIKKNLKPLYLRLNSKNYVQCLIHFKKMLPFLRGDEQVIDLRIDSLAYIKRY